MKLFSNKCHVWGMIFILTSSITITCNALIGDETEEETMNNESKTTITPIKAKELKAILDEDDSIILVNAMPLRVYRDCHIKASGSINAPFYQDESEWKKWEQALLEKYPNAKNEPIYVYCASYSCAASQKECNLLQKMGFKKIFQYKGGTREWLEIYGKEACVGVCKMEYLYQ